MRDEELKEKQLQALDKTKEFIEKIEDREEAIMIVQHLIASYFLNKNNLKNR